MENTFADRLNKVLTEIKNLKMNQTIGGDSWVVYRTAVTKTVVSNREYRVLFSPETNNEFVSVLKVNGQIGETFADPNVQGLWWKPSYFASGLTFPAIFFVYSTVKGTVSVTDVTGQGLGGV